MLKTSFTLAVLLSAVTFSGAAEATVTSDGYLNVAIQLFDLDPTDGIASSIQFSHRSEVQSSVATAPDGNFDSWTGAMSTSQAPQLATANAALGATTEAAIHGLWSLSVSGSIANEGSYNSQALETSKFTLSPNTLMIVTGHANLSFGGTPSNRDYASSFALVQIINAQNASPYTQSSFFHTGAYSYNNGPQFVDDDFMLMFSNVSTSTMLGTVYVAVGASGTLSAVPEPETNSMLLGGMAVLGAMTYRKRRQAKR